MRRARGRTRIGPRLAAVTLVGLLAGTVGLLVVGLFQFADSVRHYSATPATGHADAIVALTGGAARITDAVELLESGRGARLLITGVHPDNTPATLARFTPGREALFSCCVDLGYMALNTVGNAKEARNWARDRGYRSLIVVTSAYHLPRSLNELRREMPEAVLIPHPVAADNLSLDGWWRDPGTTRLLLSEYAKYLMSLVRLRWRPATTLDAGITTAVAND